MRRTLDCYYPGKAFPSVSTTGTACSMDCKHCSGRYLEGMFPATGPEDLLAFAEALAEAGGEGLLLSGGCDPGGRVVLDRFVPAIRAIKETTSLKVNAHIGLTPGDALRDLVSSGVDAFSVDVYGDDETIREVLGLGAKATDYIGVVRHLKELGAPTVAPHICVGVMGGEIRAERVALRHLAPVEPDALVVISFVPTRGTAYASRAPPNGADIVSFISDARASLPDTRLLLGCMRSRKDRSWEAEAVMAGLDGIVSPSEGTVASVSARGLEVRRKTTCCALG